MHPVEKDISFISIKVKIIMITKHSSAVGSGGASCLFVSCVPVFGTVWTLETRKNFGFPEVPSARASVRNSGPEANDAGQVRREVEERDLEGKE